MPHSPVLSLCFVLVALSIPSAKDSEIRKAVFLGQIYPSGRIYLKQFPSPPDPPSDNDPKASTPPDNLQYTTAMRNPPVPLAALAPWPREVVAINVDAHKTKGARVTRARFVKVLVDDPGKKNQDGFATEYIPGLEAMDSIHYPCGMSENRQDTGFSYWSEDFFEYTMDHCESTQGVAVYQSDYITDHSFRVLAFRKDWELAGYKVDSRRTPRPLQPGETVRVGKAGAGREPSQDGNGEVYGMDLGENGGEPCLYGRRYRDAAKALVTAKLSRPALDLELSQYRDPLCFMHWNDIYLLDVRSDGKLVQTLELVNYRGMQ